MSSALVLCDSPLSCSKLFCVCLLLVICRPSPSCWCLRIDPELSLQNPGCFASGEDFFPRAGGWDWRELSHRQHCEEDSAVVIANTPFVAGDVKFNINSPTRGRRLVAMDAVDQRVYDRAVADWHSKTELVVQRQALQGMSSGPELAPPRGLCACLGTLMETVYLMWRT